MGNELNIDEQLQEDWLDAKLRDEAPYLDDAGFTARVAQQLPARGRSRSMRAFILLGVTLIACAIAYFVTGKGALFADAAAFLVAMPFVTVCAIALCCGLIATALGTSFAVLKSRDQRS